MRKFSTNKISFNLSVCLVIIILLSINILFGYISRSYGRDLSGINGYSVWYFSTYSGIGSILMIFSPIIIIYFSLKDFHKSLKTRFIEKFFAKIEYKKYIRKTINRICAQSFLFFPLAFTILLIGTVLIFGTEPIINKWSYLGSFPNVSNQLSYIILMIISMFIFSVSIIGIGLILIPKFEKFFLVIAVSFLTIWILGYLETLIFTPVINSIFGANSVQQLTLFDLYTTSNAINIIPQIAFGIIRLIAIYIFVFLTYKNKEKIIKSY